MVGPRLYAGQHSSTAETQGIYILDYTQVNTALQLKHKVYTS